MSVQEALAALEAAARDVDKASNEACHTGKMSVTWTMLWYLRQAIAALDLARKEEAERCPTCGGTGGVYDSADTEPVLRECPDCDGTGNAKVTPAAPLAGERDKE